MRSAKNVCWDMYLLVSLYLQNMTYKGEKPPTIPGKKKSSFYCNAKVIVYIHKHASVYLRITEKFPITFASPRHFKPMRSFLPFVFQSSLSRTEFNLVGMVSVLDSVCHITMQLDYYLFSCRWPA